MIPQPFIQELLSRVDIVEVVGRQVELKKAGIHHKGLCPFHGEKNPSFTVSPSRQTYHCFGCGVHGDAIRFLMENSGMAFHDAVRDLAQQVGLVVPEDEASPEERERAKRQRETQATLSEVLERASEHYRKQLKTHPNAIDYLKRRGLTGEVAAQFGLGYAPEGWRTLASAFPRYDDPLLEEAGLVIRQGEDEADAKRYDRFRDRIMFPIRSVQGEVIGFGGRVLDKGEPKYLNSPETPVFSKGRELYGLHEARTAMRQRGYALVVEGYMDVVALAQLGLQNAVATLGTACTAEHMQKLFRFTDSVVFSFDGDAAGRRAAGRALEASLPHASDTRSIRFLFLPAEHDPDSYVREHGTAAFEALVAKAVPLSRQLIEHSSEDCDLGSAEGRAKLLANAKPLWHALPDGALRRQLLGDLAAAGHLGVPDLTELWRNNPPKSRGEPQAGAETGAGHSGRDAPPSQGQQGQQGARGQQGQRGNWRGNGPGASRYGQDSGGGPPPPQSGGGRRRTPASNADHALRMLLLHSEWWDQLTPADHEFLHRLPAPHGEIVAWLERQLTDHGSCAWAALKGGLEGLEDESENAAMQDAVRRIVPAMSEQDEVEFAELRGVMNRLWISELEQEKTKLAPAMATDAAARQRWRDLDERIRQLKPLPTAN